MIVTCGILESNGVLPVKVPDIDISPPSLAICPTLFKVPATVSRESANISICSLFVSVPSDAILIVPKRFV